MLTSLRLHLGEARLRLRGWKKILQQLRQSRSHPPLTWELTAIFATVMAKWGRHAEAVATLVAFDCYLRTQRTANVQSSEYRTVLCKTLTRCSTARKVQHGRSLAERSLKIRRCSSRAAASFLLVSAALFLGRAGNGVSCLPRHGAFR